MPAADALFDLPESRSTLPPSPHGWPEQPIGKIVLESGVPHLDRVFDYLIPMKLDQAATPGVKVKVRFGARSMTGWLIERTDAISTGAKLVPISSVVTALPILSDSIFQLAREIAHHYAGNVADVLRNAIPSRVVRVERAHAERLASGELEPAAIIPKIPAPASTRGDSPDSSHFSWHMVDTEETLFSFDDRENPVVAAISLPSAHSGWDAMDVLIEAGLQTLEQGRTALIVVPDNRTVDYLERRIENRLGSLDLVARLSADQGPTPRYRSFLHILSGLKRFVIGTRSAIWAPLENIGTMIIWEDSDELLIEPRAPYYHVPEVARQRANSSNATLIFASTSRSLYTQNLVETQQAIELEIPRPLRREVGPRVLSTADSFHSSRDRLAQIARLPSLAWRTAREALAGKNHPAGPVLIQVARAGFIPGLVCERCRTPARCRHCSGPLGFSNPLAVQRGEPSCRWCGTLERNFQCTECGDRRLRAGSRGVDRTAEELGRAFPMVPVLSSSADHMLSTVPNEPAIIVSTLGSEPVAEQGYAAALLLDGDSLLQREGLNVPETVLRHWMRAATLVRPATEGGAVVVTAHQDDVVGALVRLNPMNWAQRELQERQQLSLPPVMRVAEITSDLVSLNRFMQETKLPYQADGTPWIGPTPVEDQHRALLFFPHHVSDAVTASLRATRATLSARASVTPVRLRLDPVDVL